MYLRLTFTAEGENFQPKKFLKDFIQESILANYDKNFPHYLTFIHQKEFSDAYWDKAYEQADEQCNFQIFDKDFLKLIGNCEIDLPISIYTDS